MNNLEKVMELVRKNNGFVTTKEVVSNNINKMALKRLCDRNELKRVSTGYYVLFNNLDDDYFNVISKSKNAIFSHSTSLFLHNLSDRTPLSFDITVPVGYGGVLQNISNVNLHYVNRDILTLGLLIMKSPFGMDVKCYDMERTICDIIRDKKYVDVEIYTKALKWYANRKDKDLLKLVKYSKKLNLEREVVELMRIIL